MRCGSHAMKRFGSVLLTVGFVAGAAEAHFPASCVALLSEILTFSTDEEAAVIALLLVAEEHALAPSQAGQEQYSELAAAVGKMLKAYAEMNSKEVEFLSCIHSEG